MRQLFIILFLAAFCMNASAEHLFILSGQSNMARFKPELVFLPAVEAEFGKENVIVVKDAQGGQPIKRWYPRGDLYARLMEKVNPAITGHKIETITFIWMQGEADAKAGNAEVYLTSLNGLKGQLEDDLKRTDINYVVGRLSDSGFFKRSSGKPVENPQWDALRKAQMAFGDAHENAVWIDTDDLNGEKNELHYIKPDGYATLGERYAEQAIQLIKREGK